MFALQEFHNISQFYPQRIPLFPDYHDFLPPPQPLKNSNAAGGAGDGGGNRMWMSIVSFTATDNIYKFWNRPGLAEGNRK